MPLRSYTFPLEMFSATLIEDNMENKQKRNNNFLFSFKDKKQLLSTGLRDYLLTMDQLHSFSRNKMRNNSLLFQEKVLSRSISKKLYFLSSAYLKVYVNVDCKMQSYFTTSMLRSNTELQERLKRYTKSQAFTLLLYFTHVLAGPRQAASEEN